jgi:hypothetical protein
MSSEPVANSSPAAEGLTPAQKLMETHDLHKPTVEDVIDEEDIIHPPPSAALKKTDDSTAPALSEKAAGKQKAEDAPAPALAKKAPALNTASEDAFPALGPVKPRAAAVAPTWSKKPTINANGVNGQAPTNGTNARGPALPTMNLPGKHKQQLLFDQEHLVPRSELKKPMLEIVREINKRSKAKLEVKTGGPGGKVVFEATGPVDAVREILQDAANQFGKKVCEAL